VQGNASAGRGNKSGKTIQKRLLKTSEAAVYLSCSAWKIRKLVLEGKLPYVADSEDTDWRFDIRDLDAFIDMNKHTEETIE
jgi:excisionase family DNA binding protein